MSKHKIKSPVYLFLVLTSAFLAAGCATVVYQADFSTIKKPAISLPEAYQHLKVVLEKAYHSDDSRSENVQVSRQGVTWTNDGANYSSNFGEIQNLAVSDNPQPGGDWYCLYWYLCWKSQSDAQDFVDTVGAIKYYANSKQVLTDDGDDLANFQEKAKAWLALPQKPPLPEEVHRFVVLKDDAIQNKEFEKAADFYEQGLTIDPMWPAGQFNVALIYEQLKIYPMAVMHMKRYLVLEPAAKDARADQDKIYLWEEKAKESNE